MPNIKLDLSNTGIEKEDIFVHSDVVKEIDDELIEKSKKKKEFVGWLNLPSKYKNTNEYKRIKEAAKRIQSNSDILLVIGIGGSYLGARAVIEALHSSIYDADKSKTHVIYVGNNLADIYGYFDDLTSGDYMKENDPFGTMLILYVPDKDLSSGHSRGHIGIDAQ